MNGFWHKPVKPEIYKKFYDIPKRNPTPSAQTRGKLLLVLDSKTSDNKIQFENFTTVKNPETNSDHVDGTLVRLKWLLTTKPRIVCAQVIQDHDNPEYKLQNMKNLNKALNWAIRNKADYVYCGDCYTYSPKVKGSMTKNQYTIEVSKMTKKIEMLRKLDCKISIPAENWTYDLKNQKSFPCREKFSNVYFVGHHGADMKYPRDTVKILGLSMEEDWTSNLAMILIAYDILGGDLWKLRCPVDTNTLEAKYPLQML